MRRSARRISALVDEGAVGRVRSVRWRTLRTQPAIAVSAEGVANWRVDRAQAGGGVLTDHGWHALYCVMRWAGVPAGLTATLETRRFHDQPLEDTATVALDSAAGVSSIFLTWAADERANRIEIEGDKGEIRALGDARDSEDGRRASAAGRRRRCRKGRTIPTGSAESPPTLWPLSAGRRSNLDEAMLCARLIDAAQRSSAAGGARVSLAG